MDPERALWRSQRSSRQERLDGIPNVSVNSDRPSNFPRVVVPSSPTSSSLLPHLPMWPSPRRGHHRAACAEEGVLEQGDWHWSGQLVAQVCREGGGRVSTNVMVRNFDFDGAQLAIDTTMVG